MTKDNNSEAVEKDEVPPSKQLASAIAEALVAAGLTASSRKDLLATKLTTGHISAEEWRTEIAMQIRAADGRQKGAES